jgi:GNAT superfamily N-acetyltransferase
VVEDAWQKKGLGSVLVERLRELAEGRGIDAFTATILSENRPALRLVRRVFPNALLALDGTEMNALLTFELSPAGH